MSIKEYPDLSLRDLKIGFTGHRDRAADPTWLRWVDSAWPGATWVHGGADGFDSQVDDYAEKHEIDRRVIRPDYDRHPHQAAPLIRNRDIVDQCAFLVALYDGRQGGGTAYTVNYARKKRKPVILMPLTVETIEQLALPMFD